MAAKKKKDLENPLVQRAFYIEVKEWIKLTELADAEGKSSSMLVREAVAEYLAKPKPKPKPKRKKKI